MVGELVFAWVGKDCDEVGARADPGSIGGVNLVEPVLKSSDLVLLADHVPATLGVRADAPLRRGCINQPAWAPGAQFPRQQPTRS